jgi:transcriptional regulator with XRE-family HTH domain
MSMDLPARFGAALKRARAERGLTQEDVAERADISQPFYARLERGLQLPSVPTLIALALSLRTTTDQLLGLSSIVPAVGEETPAETAALRRFLRKVRDRDASELLFLSDVLHASDRLVSRKKSSKKKL